MKKYIQYPRWIKYIPLCLVFLIPVAAAQQLALPIGSFAISPQVSADSVSNFVFKKQPTNPVGAGQGNATGLVSLTTKIGATSGYLLLFDATALPANGAVSSCTDMSTSRPCLMYCWPVTSNGTNGDLAVEWSTPLWATTGIVAGFSTTGCDTLTASATAKFSGQAL